MQVRKKNFHVGIVDIDGGISVGSNYGLVDTADLSEEALITYVRASLVTELDSIKARLTDDTIRRIIASQWLEPIMTDKPVDTVMSRVIGWKTIV